MLPKCLASRCENAASVQFCGHLPPRKTVGCQLPEKRREIAVTRRDTLGFDASRVSERFSRARTLETRWPPESFASGAGGGRIGRALAEKVLAQSVGRPTLTALAATILARRKSYYEALERNNTEIDITDWLAWHAATALEGQRRTIALVDFLIDKTRLLDRVAPSMNERQRKTILRVLREGPEGFKGGLSAANYIAITGATANRYTRLGGPRRPRRFAARGRASLCQISSQRPASPGPAT